MDYFTKSGLDSFAPIISKLKDIFDEDGKISLLQLYNIYSSATSLLQEISKSFSTPSYSAQKFIKSIKETIHTIISDIFVFIKKLPKVSELSKILKTTLEQVQQSQDAISFLETIKVTHKLNLATIVNKVQFYSAQLASEQGLQILDAISDATGKDKEFAEDLMKNIVGVFKGEVNYVQIIEKYLPKFYPVLQELHLFFQHVVAGKTLKEILTEGSQFVLETVQKFIPQDKITLPSSEKVAEMVEKGIMY